MSTIPPTINTSLLVSSLYQAPESKSETLKNVDLFAMAILNQVKQERNLKHKPKVTITVKDDAESTLEFLSKERKTFSPAMDKVIDRLKELARDKKFEVSGGVESIYSPLLGCSIEKYKIVIIFPEERKE